MTRQRSPRLLAASALMLAAAFTAATAVPADPKVKVGLAGSVERGGRAVALDEAGGVGPGEVLTWRMTITNPGPGFARNLRVRGHVSAGTAFVPGSAAGDTQPRVLYSVDGGRTFSERPTVWITGADGARREVAAPPGSYTDVEFHFDALAPNQTKSARYQTRVRQ